MKPPRKLILAAAAFLATFAASVCSAGLGFQANLKAQASGPDAKLGQVEVSQVNSNSAAERGGLKAGDVIEQVNGTAVAGLSSRDFYKTLTSLKPGDTVVFGVLRASKHLTLKLTAD